jgi:hypothetical protein
MLSAQRGSALSAQNYDANIFRFYRNLSAEVFS